ncbi:aminotransferase class III-fold pyridoxal phosphate-dependent enzyme [Actinomadura roseirufa]|uniref:aminotransferase class III-fold pyridoxal phosphate-dependent enzyme n=1 Tax=Actinomadura roseirufa TaxID=2094049 RepID=UPI001A955881|nr:aminotransferase class III-fold pyridoxal phosphate-dependent enzyme [Actinomadura roseirufa]
MTGPLAGTGAARTRPDDGLHLDHYAGHRQPFEHLGGHGVRMRLAEIGGPRAGTPFEVIDASGGYGSACLGAGHPVVRRALARAADDLGYATDEIASSERTLLLAETLGDGGLWCDHFPPGEYHVSGRNSGSEGVELALRLVLESRFDRRTLRPGRGAGRDVILAFEGAWHGWTGALTALLNRRHYRIGLPTPAAEGPYGLQVRFVPFGSAEAVRTFFAELGHRVLAVVIEPVQGDAGVLLPPEGYLRELAGLAREHGALFVADEVLTFAKTGRFFAMTDERGPIPSDVTVIGKSLGMGVLSTSMIIARRDLAVRASGAVATSDLRPLTCAVIRDGLRFIVSDGLLERSAALGDALSELLRREVLEEFPELYREHRGIGVLHGLELTETAAEHVEALRRQVILAGTYVEFMGGAGRRSHGLPYVYPTMRVAPPLVTRRDELERLVAGIRAGSAAFRGALRDGSAAGRG